MSICVLLNKFNLNILLKLYYFTILNFIRIELMSFDRLIKS
jgi:hypothetical protein